MNKMKIKIKKSKELVEDIDDENYGYPDDLRRLSKGITEVIIPSDDVIYEKSKYIIRLNRIIDRLKASIQKLNKDKDKLSCNKPSHDDLMNYCNELSLAVKGKYSDEK